MSQEVCLLEDFEIVQAAGENDGATLQYCPVGETRKTMLQEPYLMDVVSTGGGGIMLTSASKKYWSKKQYLRAAAAHGEPQRAGRERRLWLLHRVR